MSIMMAALMATMAPATAQANLPIAAPDFTVQSSEYRKKRRSSYNNRSYNSEGRRLRSNERVWQDSRGQWRCKRDNGTTGLVIGAAVGGVAGHEIAGRGDKLLGVVIGAGAGALLGREIDRSGNARCR